MQRDTQDLLDEIYPCIQARADTAFPEFAFKRGSKGWEATAGTINGDKAQGHLYHYDDTPFCFKNHKTGEAITLWNHVRDTKGLTSNREVLEELARLGDYALPKVEGYSWERAEKARERSGLLETAFDFFERLLWGDQGKETLEYLKSRGYTEEDIRAMELGHFPGEKETRAYLYTVNRDYSENRVNEVFQYLKWREDYKVVIPWRESGRNLKALWGRLTRALKEGEKEGDKYKPFTGEATKGTPFNLPAVIGQKKVVVVEGYFDALVATARGIEGVVATGGTSLSQSQLAALTKYGAKYIFLALDSDEAGQKGTEKALTLINQEGLAAFVVDLPEGCSDPDELIVKEGEKAFGECIEEAYAGARWMAGRILGKHSIQKDTGQREAIDEALTYEETLRDPLDSRTFLETIGDGLDIPGELLEERTRDYRERKARERLQREYGEFFRKGQRFLQEGKLPELREYVDGKVPELRARAVTRQVQPYSLYSLEEDIAQTPEGLKTGYESLDGLIRIPQEAITIVAGRPSHGKSTFLFNLCLNMIGEYEDKAFFFFSYEETRKQVGLKFLNILSGEVIDERQNLIQLERYLRGGNTNKVKIEAGKAKFGKLTRDGRLWIIDEPYFVGDLGDCLSVLAEKHNIGAVFIDYIQKVKIRSRHATRQVELQKISEQLLEIAKSLSVPIILGAQLGRDKEHRDKVRLDNLREAGDIENDAHVVIGLYNQAMQKAQDAEERLQDSKVDLKLTILKNRDGVVNEETVLDFERPILTIRDKTGGGTPF